MSDSIHGLSPEERAKLAKTLTQEVNKKKAEELGALQGDIAQRMVGGKYKWVKKADLLKEEEAKRRLSAREKPLRALRGGADSITAKIADRIESTQKMASELTINNVLNSLESVDFNHAISNILTKSGTHTKELKAIEEAIEQQKNRDPVFAEGEKVLMAMHLVSKEGDMENVAKLRANHGALLAQYDSRRKALSPLIESARHERFGLQRDYWKIMNVQWSLDLKHAGVIRPKLIQFEKIIPSPSIRAELKSELRDFHIYWDSLTSRQAQLAASTPSKNEDAFEAGKKLDEILPQMEAMIEESAFLVQTILELRERYESFAKDKPDSDANRMAFADRKK